jgi:thymidylate synthase (FAD)
MHDNNLDIYFDNYGESSMYKNYEDILSVKLISYTQPNPEEFSQEFIDDGIQNLISYCARVSNPSNQNNLETVDKLLNYLIENKHWSPFEMVDVCLEITSTRDIVRQILRHRSFSFQEFSQRYADPTKELDFCLKECRLQDKKNRQNSILIDNDELAEIWKQLQIKVINVAKTNYEYAISQGIAKEVARVMLPEGNTVSRMYIKGSIRSWIHYIEVRDGNGTQKEHMLVARACAEAINKIFPYIK